MEGKGRRRKGKEQREAERDTHREKETERDRQRERERKKQRGWKRSHGRSYLFGRQTERKETQVQAGKKICLPRWWMGKRVDGACLLKGQE